VTPEQRRHALTVSIRTVGPRVTALLVESWIDEARAVALEQAAEHLDAARMNTWHGGTRRINGWHSAADEIRNIAHRVKEGRL